MGTHYAGSALIFLITLYIYVGHILVTVTVMVLVTQTRTTTSTAKNTTHRIEVRCRFSRRARGASIKKLSFLKLKILVNFQATSPEELRRTVGQVGEATRAVRTH